MCRSRHEQGGPARCPSHARAKLAAALAEVLALEAREVELYRQASQQVADLVAPAEQAQAWYRQARREVEDLRVRNGEDGVDAGHYRQAYRDLVESKRAAEQVRAAQRPARELLDRRRRVAVEALTLAGVSGDDAQRALDGIDVDTELCPPFI